ncbi:esterase-like activity of phytase family protein [Neisseria sp. CCUG12390]|uniref:esterase-like activity of phytase family protein n=1 Tax=Neisseria sp. CCUG12390 TaxID=3392035 RepID=UPI003A1006C1
MNRTTLVYAALVSLFTPAVASAQAHEAVLAGHAVLPAKTFIQAPHDAPETLRYSGKFTTSSRVENPESIEGKSDKRPTGVFLPFDGQPVQGHSGIQRMNDGSYWVLTDNGAGSKANSPDFILHLSQYRIDFKSGRFHKQRTVFLHDPDKKIPFHITHEATGNRYLTGADLDPESFQIIGNRIWIGEEFGPYLIEADLNGKIINLYETQIGGRTIMSPDHHAVRTPAAPTEKITFQAKRSKGYEGMAASPDGKRLYPMLEGPLWDESKNAYENSAGKTYLRILSFDTHRKEWGKETWRYPLEHPDHAIGDFNMIDNERALVIERDNGEGVTEYACKNQTDTARCFNNLPKFKRVYLIRLNQKNAGGFVEKLGYVDLLNIQDPDRISKKPLSGGKFVFPFFTIENVDIADNEHIIVGNDNNLPFSSSRLPNQADDNEMILLKVPGLLSLGK